MQSNKLKIKAEIKSVNMMMLVVILNFVIRIGGYFINYILF